MADPTGIIRLIRSTSLIAGQPATAVKSGLERGLWAFQTWGKGQPRGRLAVEPEDQKINQSHAVDPERRFWRGNRPADGRVSRGCRRYAELAGFV